MYDDAWQQVFKVLDFTGTNEAGWDILDVEDGLAFSKVPIQGKAQIYSLNRDGLGPARAGLAKMR
jgi:hypothetical protein